jgi:hypothetical protein
MKHAKNLRKVSIGQRLRDQFSTPPGKRKVGTNRPISRYLSLLLVLCMVLSLVPVSAFASGGGESHDHTGWTPVSSLKTISSDGNYYLTDDITLEDGSWEITSNVTLCLNGHSITGNSSTVIFIGDGQYPESSYIFTLYDDSEGKGTITGGEDSEGTGGGVYVQENSIFNMYGGSITKNNSDMGDGGGVQVCGTFNLYGGTISNNTTECSGGGVSVEEGGTFNMSGGTISDNKAGDGSGGSGVCVTGLSTATFTMTGGSITNNTTGNDGYGGGVYSDNDYATVTISGGTISNNSADSFGGGVCMLGGTLEVSGSAEISYNSVTEGPGAGGVYLSEDTSGTITGSAKVINNTTNAYDGAGGVYVDAVTSGGDKGASLTVSSNAQITNNTNTSRDNSAVGGVYVKGAKTSEEAASVTVADSVQITGNTTNGTNSNLSVSAGSTLTVEDSLTANAIIGLTLAEGATVKVSANGSVNISGIKSDTTGNGYSISSSEDDGGSLIEAPHVHSYAYSGHGAVITAFCANCGDSQTATLEETSSGATYTYTGLEIKPMKVTVSSGWPIDVPTITYEKNIDAGENTAIAKITVRNGDGKDAAEATLNFTIDKATLTPSATAQEKSYDGTTSASVSVSFTGLQNNETLSKDTDYTVSANFADANVGTGKTVNVTVTLNNTENANNYTLSSTACATTATIAAKELTPTNMTVTQKEYDGTNTATISGYTLSTGVGEETLTENVDFTVSAVFDGIGAGTNKATFKFVLKNTDTAKNYSLKDGGSYTVDASIVKKPVDVPTLSNLPYDGNQQSAGVEGGLFHVVSNVGGINVAQYNVELALNDTANYEWNIVNDTNTSDNQTLSYEITQATNEWTTAPGITGWTYGDTANTPAGAAKFGTVKVEYKVSSAADSTYTTNVPTNAGSYTVRFTVEGTTNYTGLRTTTSLTINAKDISKAVITLGGTLTYNGKEQTKKISSVKVDGLDVTYTVDGNKQTNAGNNYSLTVTGTGNFTGKVTKNWNIAKATLTVTADTQTKKYGETDPALTYKVKGLVSGDTEAIVTGSLTREAGQQVGEYAITQNTEDQLNAGNNYTINFVPATLTITENPGATINTTTTDEDGNAVVTKVNDANKVVETIVTDKDGNVTKTEHQESGTTLVTKYDSTNQLTESLETREEGDSTQIVYNNEDGSNEVTERNTNGEITKHQTNFANGSYILDGFDPELIEGDGVEYDGKNSLKFRSNDDLENFLEVILDEEVLDSQYYVLTRGSIRVELTTEYLDTLEPGEHALTIVSTNGEASGTFTISEEEEVVVPIGHSYQDVVTAPTCTEKGYTTHICSVCGDSYTDSQTAALGHDYVEANRVAATCTKKGSVSYKCSRCDATYTEELPIVDCACETFTDTDNAKWYHEAVDYVLNNSLMNGYGNGTFGPNDQLNRAMMMQILYNREGKPAVTYTNVFTDVAEGNWFASAVLWGNAQKIALGYGNGKFGSYDNITREQMVVMLWRYAGSPKATATELNFTDARQVSSYATEAMLWAVESGIIQGTGNGALKPTGTATRAQAATMLMRFVELQK